MDNKDRIRSDGQHRRAQAHRKNSAAHADLAVSRHSETSVQPPEPLVPKPDTALREAELLM